jgi:hypothetical protein
MLTTLPVRPHFGPVTPLSKTPTTSDPYLQESNAIVAFRLTSHIRTSTFRQTATRRLAPALTVFCVTNVLVAAVGMPLASASTNCASQSPTSKISTTTHSTTTRVPLGTAANFAVLGGSTVTNTGRTTINGDLGLRSGSSVTGFSPGRVNGTIHASDSVALQAKADLAVAYDAAASRRSTATAPVELGGTTKTPGVYDSRAGTFEITGTLTLDAKGDPNAVFIFKAESTLVTASASTVKLVNGAQASHVFWKVGSSATLGTHSLIRGNILALTSITVTTGVTVDGRALTRNAAVTLDTAEITIPGRSHQ